MKRSGWPFPNSATMSLASRTRRRRPEFTVSILRKPVEHKVRLNQVERWAEHTVKEGPAGILRRERVRKLLSGEG